ncbi:mandelate racemase/muconate lactonizing enzyme family protein [Thermosulfuriphilus sp.]
MRLKLYRLHLPFRLSVDHSLASRKSTESLIVIWEEDGLTGLGEGCPREYVTGEKPQEAYQMARRLARAIVEKRVSSPGEFDQIVNSLALQNFPSVICAFETALLDLKSRQRGDPLWRLFGLAPRTKELIYSLVLPFTNERTFAFFTEAARKWAIKEIKIKVAPGAEEMVRRVHQSLPHCRLRLDANGAFGSQEALEFLEKVRPYGVIAFEQPCPRQDLEGLQKVSSCGLVPVIVDESLIDLDDALKLIEKNACQVFNLRLSKCGGIRKTLALWSLAKASGLKAQIGCHVGETGILAMAGRHLAVLLDEVLFLEGSYSPWLLEEDIIKERVDFAPQGRAPVPKEPGLGINPRMETLLRFSPLNEEFF